jgi:hypothetical protein
LKFGLAWRNGFAAELEKAVSERWDADCLAHGIDFAHRRSGVANLGLGIPVSIKSSEHSARLIALGFFRT